MYSQAFTDEINALLGNESEAFFAALKSDAPVSIRLHRSKGAACSCAAAGDAVPWCALGRYLAQRPVFTLDPLLHGGAYYVQEASSMFTAHAVSSLTQGCTPLRALDLCAAPGGKSTLLADNLPDGSLLVANEAIRSRVAQLAENLTKWGNPDVAVTSSDPKCFARMAGFFDLMLADAPCSGEGMFRKDANAVAEWSEANVLLCAERQRRIVADAWPALREGGILLYSTCTFNRRENESNAAWFRQHLGATPVNVGLRDEWRIARSSNGCYRFFPHRTRGEGFFMAVLQKTSAEKSAQQRARVPKLLPLQANVGAWLRKPDDFVFWQKEGRITAVPAAHAADIFALREAVNVQHCGIPMAEIKGRDAIPTAALALSTALNAGAFPQLDLDLPSALQYLRKEALAGDAARKGYELVRYNSLPIGFVKNLGTRRNNLFPQEWRIRMNVQLTM